MSRSGRSAGRTRFAYASSPVTRRSASKATRRERSAAFPEPVEGPRPRPPGAATSVPQPEALGAPEAAGPVRRRHRPLALGLDLAEREQAVCGAALAPPPPHPELAGRELRPVLSLPRDGGAG